MFHHLISFQMNKAILVLELDVCRFRGPEADEWGLDSCCEVIPLLPYEDSSYRKQTEAHFSFILSRWHNTAIQSPPRSVSNRQVEC